MVSTAYLLKYSLILSLERFSGRFPTQRCLVSLTMVETGHKPASWPPCPGTELPSLDDSHQTPAQPVISLLSPFLLSQKIQSQFDVTWLRLCVAWLTVWESLGSGQELCTGPGLRAAHCTELCCLPLAPPEPGPEEKQNGRLGPRERERERGMTALTLAGLSYWDSEHRESVTSHWERFRDERSTGLLLTENGWWLISADSHVLITFWNEECD